MSGPGEPRRGWRRLAGRLAGAGSTALPETATGVDGGAVTSDPVPVIEMRGISKRFGTVRANEDISLTLRAGEIHALLGENGAGKTTLMNILSGMYQPDAGEILVRGAPATIHSPADALRQGIGTVYQHFTLVPNLSILENVILGTDQRFVLDLAAAERRLTEMLGDVGLNAAPNTEVCHLAIGQRQRVEIIKVLFRGSRVLLLDEPTSVLTPVEVEGLFGILRRLKASGVAVVLITHKLEEALALSDRVTILRQGRTVGEVTPADLAAGHDAARRRIVELMFGGATPSDADLAATGRHPGPVLLSARDITALDDRGAPAVQGLSFDLHAGEIFGIAGVDGNGQKELGEVIAGQRGVTGGIVVFEGRALANQGVGAALRAGIGYVTDDRLGEGAVSQASIAENVVLKSVTRPPYSNGFWLNRTAIAEEAWRLINAFDVRAPGPATRIGLLSGGNIQKLLLARELALDPRVLVCNKPTHGLDLKTARFVIQTLREQADAGKGVILISSELEELLAVSDRIGVVYNGRLVAVFPRAQADPETIGRVMLSGSPDRRAPA